MPQPLDLTGLEWETESEEFRNFIPWELNNFLPQLERQKRPLAQPEEVSRPFGRLLKEKFTHANFEEEEAQVTISCPSADTVRHKRVVTLF